MKAKNPNAAATCPSLHILWRILTRGLTLQRSTIGPMVSAVRPAAATQSTERIPKRDRRDISESSGR
jgi:hypothetical protein